jgi:hypothetical protein
MGTLSPFLSLSVGRSYSRFFCLCSHQVQSFVRVLFIGLMLATNGLMLNFFIKGLHETDSLTATVTSAAVNFMLSVRIPFFFCKTPAVALMTFVFFGLGY